MHPITEFIQTPTGRQFLESNGVFIDQPTFEAELCLPVQPDLAAELHQPGKKLVCSGQQIYVDYRQSVLSKVEILRDMAPNEEMFGFFLWVDTDRAGSDNLITKFAWPNFSKKGPITIMPTHSREVEARFVQTEAERLTSAIDKLETYLRQYAKRQQGAKERFMQLRAMFVDDDAQPLSAFNLQLTNFLLEQVYGYAPPALMLSQQLGRPAVIAEIELFINNLPEVVQVFNEAIETVAGHGLDPQLSPFDEHYLPLFYSCQRDNQRLRLYHHTKNGDHFAGGRCRCGQSYDFYLGRNELALDEIEQTGRWSPDVCFPIYFNDRVSGFVAGKSSGIYLMVLGAVMRRVLGKKPVPVLLPTQLTAPEPDSLLYRYMALS
jgi:hypothetical protein